jgi:hypothetical protein
MMKEFHMNHDELVAYLDKLNELMRMSSNCSGVRIEYSDDWLKIAVGSDRVQHEVGSPADLPAVRAMLAVELHDQVSKSLVSQKESVRESLGREKTYAKEGLEKIANYEKTARNVVRASKILANIKKPLIPGAPKATKTKK